MKYKQGFTLAEGATHVGNYNSYRKRAFTLAEVLITLGIIGVVASMTVPTLMVDINTKQWSTAKDVFNKKLNEAMKNMNTAQEISGHPNTLSFVQGLAKHFKTNKICRNDELQNCFSETVWWGAGEATPEEIDMTTIQTANHFGLDWGTELIGVQFANGVTGLVAYNPKCSGDPLSNLFNGTACISMLYDVSGSKNPNTSGKDIGNYGAINRLGNSGCFAEINGVCLSMAPQIPTPHAWNACDSNGNTTDPEDLAFMSKYGISQCMNGSWGTTDAWAGAAELCGGTGKMASMAQIAKIADYLYNTTGIGAYEDVLSDISIDESKVAAAGIVPLGYAALVLWAGEEDGNSAGSRVFGENGTGIDYHDRDTEYAFAVCIGN